MTDYQKLRVCRITTPSKICGGMRCLLVNSKRFPVIFGMKFLSGVYILWLKISFSGSKISDFKQIVVGMGGETNSSQVVLSSSSTDTKLITKVRKARGGSTRGRGWAYKKKQQLIL